MNRWNDVVTSKGFRFESDLGFLNNVHILIRPEEYMKVIIYITRIKKYMYIYFVYISKYNFIIPFFFLSRVWGYRNLNVVVISMGNRGKPSSFFLLW